LFESQGKTTFRSVLAISLGPNPQLLYPTLALAAFLGWKAAWAVVERQRARHESLG